jgi:leucyl aminopeptidase
MADVPVLRIRGDGAPPAPLTLRILSTDEAGRMVLCEALADEVLLCAADSRDRARRMMRWKEYQERFQSNFIGMRNPGGRPAGAMTACFHSWPVEGYRWAHLAAGTASVDADRMGATGRPVPLRSLFPPIGSEQSRDGRGA